MKKIFLTFSVLCLFLIGCSKNDSKKDVEIIFKLITMVEDETTESYAKDLSESTGDDYYAYNDEYYALKTSEKEREKFLKKCESTGLHDPLLKDMNSSYPDVFLKMEYNGKDTVSVFVNNKLYQEADFGVVLVAQLAPSIYVDTIQAYNLVPYEERECTVEIVDSKTDEVIYSSDE